MKHADVRKSSERLSLLLVLLAFFAVLARWYDPGLGVGTDDGNYYYQIARHVEAGEGLQTDVSLYNRGLRTLPHFETSPPVWPLILGYSGRLVGLDGASEILSDLFYLTTLILLYFLANRVAGLILRRDPPYLFESWKTLDVGHAMVALFGTNHVFFQFSSAPFTEPLGFTLLIAMFLLADSSVQRTSTWLALAAGGVGALAYLTRYQFIVVLVCMIVAYALVSRRDRELWRTTIAFTSAAALPAVAWWIVLRTRLGRFPPLLILDFAAYKETPEIGATHTRFVTHGAWDAIVDKLHGFVVAFDPASYDSYVHSFSVAAFLVPVAIVVFVFSRSDVVAAWSALREKLWFLPVAVAGSTFALLAMIQMLHYQVMGWLFGYRHGLHLIFAILLGAAYLLRRRDRWSPTLVVLAIFLSLVSGFRSILDLAGSNWPLKPSNSVRLAAAWLDARPVPPVVLAPHAELLVILSRGGFHTINCLDSPEVARNLVTMLPIDYVVRIPRDRVCGALDALGTDLELVRSFGKADDVSYVYRIKSRPVKPADDRVNRQQ